MIISYEEWLRRIYHIELNSKWAEANKQSLMLEYRSFCQKFENSKYPHKRFVMMGRNLFDDRTR